MLVNLEWILVDLGEGRWFLVEDGTTIGDLLYLKYEKVKSIIEIGVEKIRKIKNLHTLTQDKFS